jgi:probable O-glycosylation ligase (exosortase A-associated)
MAVLSLRRAHLGVMLWVWSSLFPLNDFLFGFAQAIPFSKISVACAVLGLIFDKRRSITADKLIITVFIFFASVSISYAMSSSSLVWGDDLYSRFAKAVMAMLFIQFVAIDRLRLHSILVAMCLAVGAGAADEGLKFVLSAGAHHVKGTSSWGDENITAAIILLCLPILLYLHRYANNKIFKDGIIIVFVICNIAIVGTYSRGGFLGLLVFYGMAAMTFRSRVSIIVWAVLLGTLALFLMPDSWMARIGSTTNAGADSSFMGRVVQWKILTLMALDHPFFGSGMLANMDPAIWKTYAARLVSELTFIQTPMTTRPYASHSIYFQVLGEDGFIGLFLFVVVFSGALGLVRDVRKRAERTQSQGWAIDLATAMRTSLVLFLVTGAALPIPYLEFPYLLIGCLSALRQIQRRELKQMLRERNRLSAEVAAKTDLPLPAAS